MVEHTFAIIAYKESPHIQECIDSLKNQSQKSNIVICTSTPSIYLENIAQKNNLTLFINSNTNGIVGDWNFALEKTSTNYATLAHQDDIYHSEYAKIIMTAAKERNDALIIFSDYDELVCTGNKTRIRKNSLNFFVKKTMLKFFFNGKTYIVKNKQKLLALGNPIGCPTVTFKKNSLGDFKFDKAFSINLDWKAWYDIAQKKGSFVWVRKILVSHRIYPESETSQGLAENRRQQDDLEMFQKIWPRNIALILSKIYSLSYKNNN